MTLAVPSRSRPDNASPVLARKQQRVDPKPPLQVGADCSFAEWQVTSVASRSRTRPDSSCPEVRTAGMPSPVSAACSQATFRVEARGERREGSARSLTSASSRQAVGCRGDRAEHFGLVPQHGQIRNRLAAIGERHREVSGDPARIMSGPARGEAARARWSTWRSAQWHRQGPQQPCPGMTDHPEPSALTY